LLDKPSGKQRIPAKQEIKNLIQGCAEYLKIIVITPLKTGLCLAINNQSHR